MGALAVKEKLASGQKTSVDAIRIIAVASLVADLHQERTAANDELASVCLVHGDHLNTPRLATNQQGVKVWSWEGEACGATAPTGSVTINLRFPGQYYDAESGLHQNWNRYYDPKLCRFLTPDPRGIRAHVRRAMARMRQGGNRAPIELNPYAYVVNNPLRWADPFGLAITGTWVSIEAVEDEEKMFYGSSVIGDSVKITVWGVGHLEGVVECTDDCTKKKWREKCAEGGVR